MSKEKDDKEAEEPDYGEDKDQLEEEQEKETGELKEETNQVLTPCHTISLDGRKNK
jgi:hypothetical protein